MARTPGSAKHKIAPVVRAAFINGLEIIREQKGKTLSQLMADAIQEHGILMVLDRVGRYVEREANVDVTSQGVSLIEVLSSIAGARHDTPVESESETVRH